MSKSTLNDRRPPALICRERGWKAGTKLVGNEGDGPTVIEITAIGQDKILAKAVLHEGKPWFCPEGTWTLSCRDWQEVSE